MQHLSLTPAAAEISVGMSMPGRDPAQAPPGSSNVLSWVCSAHLHVPSLCCEQNHGPHCGQPRGQLMTVCAWAGHCLL